jgi:nitroreductase
MDQGRLGMSVRQAIFTQRSIGRFRPDPLPVADLQLLLEAAARAPNCGNRQIARFLAVTDRARITRFGGSRRWGGPVSWR